MGSKAYVIGYGQTKSGFFPDRDMRSLLSEAYIKALDYSGIEPKQIQQMWLSHYPPQCDLQMTAGQLAIDAVGLGSRAGCISVEQACCSGSIAIHEASLAIESGRYDCVLVLGFAKMSDSLRNWGDRGLYTHPKGPFEESGFNPFYWHAGIILLEPGARGDYWKYNVTVEDIAGYNLAQYWYATKHPNSICYGKPIPTKEELMAHDGGPMEAINCDGASAVILASRDFAKDCTDPLIYIAAVSHKLESSYYAKMLDYGYGTDVGRQVAGNKPYSHSVENAWQECFEQAGLKPVDLDLVCAHESTLGTTYAHLEGMHHPYITPGRAPKWFTEGEALPGGKLPACTLATQRGGQPVGATGIMYLIENYMQLKEECGAWQVPLKNGVAAGGTSPGRPSFHILKREQ
jgi:acetyl-CoA C-acetyltransferase